MLIPWPWRGQSSHWGWREDKVERLWKRSNRLRSNNPRVESGALGRAGIRFSLTGLYSKLVLTAQLDTNHA